ncbi:MAG: hypothetical protein ABI405_09630 [Parafilimonas sp.]
MATVTALHLQYRLWIADMNADIDVMRILNDYLISSIAQEDDGDTLKRNNEFKEKFSNLRIELDAIRHEMHLNKMKLASVNKEQNQSVKIIENEIGHKALKERYTLFKETFSKTKAAFQKFQHDKDTINE